MTDVSTQKVQPGIKDDYSGTPKQLAKQPRGLIGGVLMALMVTPLTNIQDQQFSEQSERTITLNEMIQAREDFQSGIFLPERERTNELTLAERENHTRLELLARSFVNNTLSTEEEARLLIASERVKKLIPRVTASDFEFLEEMLNDVDRISKDHSNVRTRLGLDREKASKSI